MQQTGQEEAMVYPDSLEEQLKSLVGRLETIEQSRADQAARISLLEQEKGEQAILIEKLKR